MECKNNDVKAHGCRTSSGTEEVGHGHATTMNLISSSTEIVWVAP